MKGADMDEERLPVNALLVAVVVFDIAVWALVIGMVFVISNWGQF